MKDSLIQIYLFTYELGRSTNMILNTDETPLLTLYDMFYILLLDVHIYLDSEACHPGLVEG